jgi:SAM-dependent methyltransferase
LARRPVRRALEFGCGVAPVCTTHFEFHRSREIDFYLADIETVSFHYAAWKFAEFSNVLPIALSPENDFRLDLQEPLDAIFCLAVFEHLNQPLDTITAFHRQLAPGGVLIFDYIKSDAQGLDTAQGLEQRKSVIGYIRENFALLHGRLNEDDSMGLTVITPK